MSRTERERLEQLAGSGGLLTARDVSAAGIHSQVLTRLVSAGTLERVGRGRYRLREAAMSEHRGLALAAAAVPRGVICLLSALGFHEIGTQLPHEVWLALERHSRKPSLVYPRLHIVRYGGAAFHEGIEVHEIEDRPVRVYSVAKMLADLFKARNRVGVDIAVESLREAWIDRRFNMGDLERAARVCRVERVMRPYLEAIVT